MISHKHKCIFIHIPKCAGTTIKYLLFPNEIISWKDANYDKLYGWCPKRKFFMQHASSRQLLQTGLVSEEIWNSYYKFTFVRNPWDRAVSDYFWLMKDQKIKDSFKNYLLKAGKFKKVLIDEHTLSYRGDHTKPQTFFFDLEGKYKLDFVGRFEKFNDDLKVICKTIEIDYYPDLHINKSKKKKRHYSKYFNNELEQIFIDNYEDDIKELGYNFEKVQKGFNFNKLFR